MKQEKIDKILNEIYVRLYKESTPTADFNELVENAVINEFGQKEIAFMDYEITDEALDSIIKKTMKEYRVPKVYRDKFKYTIYLGCSPKTKNIKQIR